MRKRNWIQLVLMVLLLTSAREGGAASLPLLAMPDFTGRPGPELHEFYNLLTGASLAANSELPAPVQQETFALGPMAGAVLLGSDLGLANENDFGFYTDLGVGMSLNELFADVGALGIDGPPFAATFFGSDAEIGFYLQASGLNDDLWHSQSMIDAGSTAFAHMASYALPAAVQLDTTLGPIEISNGFLLAWEDLDDASPRLDGDYNDMVLVVGSIEVIPEPATASLVLAGLACIAGIRRRRARR